MSPKSCCCGLASLRAGSVAIGAALVTISALSSAGALAAVVWCLWQRDDEDDDDGHLPAEAAGALLGLSVLHLLFSSLLTHGARIGRRALLLTWLIFCAIAVILQAMAIVVAAALAGMKGAGEPACVVLAVGGVFTALLAYCFTVVLCHSLELNALATKQRGSGAAKVKAAKAAAAAVAAQGADGKADPVQIV